jgi:hypothetical protein
MGSNYTEQDTERARQAEQSSAGIQTQQLPNVPRSGLAPTAAASNRNNVAALVMIAVGVVMLLGRAFPDGGALTGGFVLLTIASCFLFFAFWKRIYGLMIPGAILAGLSVGVTFASVTSGVSVLWGLALGFLSIMFFGRALFNVRSDWAIFPAIPLFAVGLIVAFSRLPTLFAGGLVWLPLLLIGAGLYLGWGRRRA